MIGMLQLPGHRADASEALNHFAVGFHNPLVRCSRTYVKVDCVRPYTAKDAMAEQETIGAKLIAIRERSGLSLDKVAARGGWAGRSSVQRYFEVEYNPEYLPLDIAKKLIKAFEGQGTPPVSINELLTLAGVPDQGGGGFSVEDTVGSIGKMPRDIPVYGTALGADAIMDEASGTGSINVEQAALDQSEVLGYLRRPPALVGRKDVYGVYISGVSMYPRFNDGEAVFVDPRRPPMIGDDVIIHLAVPDAHDGDRVGGVLIKRLVRRSSSYIELSQFNPPISFRIEAHSVKSVHRIVPTAELFS